MADTVPRETYTVTSTPVVFRTSTPGAGTGGLVTAPNSGLKPVEFLITDEVLALKIEPLPLPAKYAPFTRVSVAPDEITIP